MRYHLRTLLLLLAIAPPVLAGTWFAAKKSMENRRLQQFDALIDEITTSIVPESTTLTEPEAQP